ncbi:hypothetical protein HNQ51_000232 [Inhella inkyongensis]|uniref:Uncharacterized protein n=1 Tax=Inhella inkyongensis TaxID=392593 RepID=A0A840S319_9BURK|nr:hypothetical protein [Inhella inkyongensis]MBB5202939.1 hypothetical protein [Inhella inkyongensis]
MKPAFRALLGLLAGLMTAVMIIALIETLGHKVWPLPAADGLNLRDPQVMAALMAKAPLGALASVVLAWCAGAASGAWIGFRLAGQPHARSVGLGVAGVIWLATGANLLAIPHPHWMMAGGLLGVPLSGWLVVRLLQARVASAQTPPSE